MIRFRTAAVASLTIGLIAATASAQDAPTKDDNPVYDIVAELSMVLHLDHDQRIKVTMHVEQFAKDLDAATTKADMEVSTDGSTDAAAADASDAAAATDAADATDASDTTAATDASAASTSRDPAALTAVKKARSDFNGSMKKTLTKDQGKTYEDAIDALIQGMFEDLAGIVIVDLEWPLDLSEEQALALEPVIGGAMRGLMAVVIEYGDAKMNTRTKIKVGKALKKVKSDLDKGLAEVLTQEQFDKYQAHKEALAAQG